MKSPDSASFFAIKHWVVTQERYGMSHIVSQCGSILESAGSLGSVRVDASCNPCTDPCFYCKTQPQIWPQQQKLHYPGELISLLLPLQHDSQYCFSNLLQSLAKSASPLSLKEKLVSTDHLIHFCTTGMRD
jgi:hypothetical protein